MEQVWNIPPNWDKPVLERLEWKTDIIRARRGTEQRRKLRAVPRQFIEYEFLTHGLAFQQIQNKLFAKQGSLWRLPIWFNAQRLTETVAANATFVPAVTEGYEFQDGGLAAIWSDSSYYQIVEIEEVTSTGLTLSSTTPVQYAAPAGTYLMPVQIGYLQDKIRFNRFAPGVASGTVQFQINRPVFPNIATPFTALGKHLLLVEPNRITPTTADWERDRTVVDFETGAIKLYDLYGASRAITAADYLNIDRQQIAVTRGMLGNLSGAWKSFYCSSFSDDITLAANIVSGETLKIYNAGVVEFLYEHLNTLGVHHPKLNLLIETWGQSWWVEISEAAYLTLPEGVAESLTVSFARPVSATGDVGTDQLALPNIEKSAIKRISFMQSCRLNSDIVEFSWVMPSVANISLSFVGGV